MTQRFLSVLLVVDSFLGLHDGGNSLEFRLSYPTYSRNRNKVKQDTSHADYHQRSIKGDLHQVSQALINIDIVTLRTRL